MCFVGNGDEISPPSHSENRSNRNTAFSFPVERSTLIQLENISLQFRREQALFLLEEIHLLKGVCLLLEMKEKLLDSDRKFLEALSRGYGTLLEAFGETLVALNRSHPEYEQPGRITE